MLASPCQATLINCFLNYIYHGLLHVISEVI